MGYTIVLKRRLGTERILTAAWNGALSSYGALDLLRVGKPSDYQLPAPSSNKGFPGTNGKAFGDALITQ